ncbi:hypothetical protein QQS21_006206 [Conoideocrella luteorostrata]|uniref:tripeptidyl-peptidase II n=1 Tax=Conoideocrella luteorostrata TaxID=1105319 RepID=A0AAJ0CMZ1_9HYPO|nr:hypothetical protein QQS21_006206 [Conoideocrella luteorostrata]
MKLTSWFLCLLGYATAALSVAKPVVVESLARTPRGWTNLGPVDRNQLIRLSIALESHGQEEFEKTLYQISDPTHARYGQHLSRGEASALIQPHQDATAAVRRWLSSANIPDKQVQDRGHFMDVSVTVGTAERLLSTKYSSFQRNSQKVIGTLEYSVPAEVRRHIAAVQPTTFFEMASFAKLAQQSQFRFIADGNSTDAQAQESKKETCDTLNTPACLRSLYNMNNNYTKPDDRSLLGVVGFSKQAAQYDQLDKYVSRFARYAKGANFTVDLVNNGTNPQGNNYPGGEANLDIQIAVAMAYKVPVRFYSTGGEDHHFKPDLDISNKTTEHIEPWLQFVSHMLELPDHELPQVMSISYGVNEQVVPRRYAGKICQIFGQLALRGMSIIVASGDTGPGASCQSNDGTNSTKFLPGFPATCPYITAVGGTQGKRPEKALNYSSGGFSEYWKRPMWQNTAVTKYLNDHGDKWKGYYNPNGRAFPDVAAQGIDFPIFNHDNVENGGGTSASAPLFASMISIINDDRLKQGKPPLGFLNPWLYHSARDAFTDITEGKSEGCKGTSYNGAPAPVVPGAGWDAVEGWDPATGLGTPLFDRLQKLAMV